MKAVLFSDLPKAAVDVLDEDYTTKVLLKSKTGKIPVPQLGPVVFTIEDEVKGAKGVEGKITAKFAFKGVSFDKVTLKGDKYAVEMSKDFSGVKVKVKGDPLDVQSLAVSAEHKCSAIALTAAADKKKFAASAVAPILKYGLFGGDVSYVSSSGAFSYNVGASALFNGIFGSVVYSSKAIASFAFSYSPIAKLTLATMFASDKPTNATVGFKYEVDPSLNIACKSSKDVPSAVATYKLSKDATLAFSATSKYADMSAKPTFGFQLTVDKRPQSRADLQKEARARPVRRRWRAASDHRGQGTAPQTAPRRRRPHCQLITGF
eukprot:CAMPEP_0184249942 /NCGR_PEP_ID=MMETSP0977-20130417/4226_1 /TAXON_ID=483370 /ORGANISM="non described non described, Strain CCMP2097" /LENGTH=319 /DNA_ID=CAMNT_0026555353 /DNA_START=38 /DNA_END=998 /DNA_ORIENTATION=-